MAQRRLVLLFPADNLLGWTLPAVLAPDTDWEVLRLCPQGSADEVLEALVAADPDAVLGSRDDEQLAIVLRRWLEQARPGAQLLTLSVATNVVETYQKLDYSIREAADLRCILGTAPAAWPTQKEVQ